MRKYTRLLLLMALAALGAYVGYRIGKPSPLWGAVAGGGLGAAVGHWADGTIGG